MTTPIAITIGEPTGIGPDVVLQLHQQLPDLFLPEKTILIGNSNLLHERAKMLGISVDFSTLSLIDIPLTETVIPGQLNKNNAAFVIDMLTHAADLAMQKKIAAIVTGPIQKSILNDAGFSIKGHTDFFARYAKSDTVMMLMNDALKVALFSDHLPLRDVPDFLTQEKLSRCLNIIIHDFQMRLRIPHPKILVCGLNPHAGENGYLGSEEKDIIIPVIEKFKTKGHDIIGPIGADVAFTPHYTADVILTMYHDQGLPVLKYVGFRDAINVTLGLPFIRTSVDHGTGLTIAGTGRADCTSLKQAILFANQLIER
ncbi:MAG: 4-hydroxythreonine-4-phosphate dehydrogenase PdxA [Coxiellaceae bacterium]|nr:4-hydroxythreonine-4-phosphate dehydrogenase PdxA [Coxiellaceae bacterium]